MKRWKINNVLAVVFIVIGLSGLINYNRNIELDNVNEEWDKKTACDVPDYILSQAHQQVQIYFDKSVLTFPESEYSDWRIKNLKWSYSYDDLNGLNLDVYQMNFEFLTENPEKVVIAGGMYITENNWVCPTYPNSTYLIIDRECANIDNSLICTLMENDCLPGDKTFTSDLLHVLSSKSDNIR